MGYTDKENVTRFNRKIWSTLLVAAIFISLLAGAAYALGLFSVQPKELVADPNEEKNWIFMSEDGTEISRIGGFEKGLSFYFTGDIAPNRAEFNPGWLPTEPTYWWPEPNADPYTGLPEWNDNSEIWLNHLECDRQFETDFFPEPGIHDVGIPYLITIEYAYKDNYLVFNGECEIVKHEVWDEYEVYELSCQKEITLPSGVTDCKNVISPENYVLMFSLDRGHVINIGGKLDLETLERIGKELEIRTTDEIVEFAAEFNITSVNIGLG